MPAALGWIAVEVDMSVSLAQVRTSFAGQAVRLVQALMQRLAARAAMRRQAREAADSCVVMGV